MFAKGHNKDQYNTYIIVLNKSKDITHKFKILPYILLFLRSFILEHVSHCYQLVFAPPFSDC